MRIDQVVVNSSPLITLFNSGQAELLPRLFSEILVPDAVWREVAEGGHQDIAAKAIHSTHWIKRCPPALPDPVVMAWDAGPGETAVISLARTTSNLRAVVDDDYARRCAQALGVKTLGTCGVILLAKRRGIIPSVKPALDALRSAGLWLSDSLVRTILIEAGEN